jgi:hypothetical protein
MMFAWVRTSRWRRKLYLRSHATAGSSTANQSSQSYARYCFVIVSLRCFRKWRASTPSAASSVPSLMG